MTTTDKLDWLDRVGFFIAGCLLMAIAVIAWQRDWKAQTKPHYTITIGGEHPCRIIRYWSDGQDQGWTVSCSKAQMAPTVRLLSWDAK